MSSLVAVCRVHTLRPDEGSVGATAIDKRPLDGSVRVRRIGLYGDVQADREYHGGYDQALYMVAEEEVDHWVGELGRDLPAGVFGENLRTRGVVVDDAVIGTRWRIGADVEVEVTGPRIPCATFARFLGEQRWVRRFAEHGRTGAYLRVVHTGDVSAGDAVQVVAVPDHGVGVAAWFTRKDPADARALLAADAAGDVRLAATVREDAEKAAAR